MMKEFTTQLHYNLKGKVLKDDYSRGMYSTDASVYQIKPEVIVLPKDENDVLTALKIAEKYQKQVLPRGGGTSLAGQTVANAMVLDFSKHMNKVLEFNPEEQWIRVQPGLVRDELNAFLAPYGLHFAPDPATSSRANVGGMVGNNSSGTKSILYGKTVDHVLGMKVALANGEVLELSALDKNSYEEKCRNEDLEGQIYREFKALIEEHTAEIEAKFPKVMRRVGGYNLDEFIHSDEWNLSKLLCGSEGTLAVTLELTLNLTPLPKYKSVCVVHFAEVLEAVRAVTPMLAFNPAAIEILDETVVQLSRKNLTTQRSCHFIEGDPAAILIVEFYSDDPQEVLERPQKMIGELQRLELGYAYPLFPEGPDYEDVWIIRKKGLGLMLGIKGKKKPLPFIEDAGIPTDVLPQYIAEVLDICKKHETEVAMYAHASVGVIHVRPILDLRDETDIQRFKAIAEDTFERVQYYGGSWSGEHGDGLVRSPFNREFFGDRLYGVFKEIKGLFDPENRMNPGKIVDAPDMRQNLRYGSLYEDKEPQTSFKFREDGSFANAIHMCTGVGECRKMLGGTMCPSFKATRDEELSTRGRANALRMAMSGQIDQDGLASHRLKEVLDLCLSCKACKSECPSNVDMAKLKSEVQQIWYKEKGIKLRDKLIRQSSVAASRFSGSMAPIINFIQKTLLFRWGLEAVAKFDHKRILPGYSRQSFSKWFRRNYKGTGTHKPQVVLFADTYLNYHEPQIGKSATQLLDKLGFEVILADVGCCQRPRISHGFLEEAKMAGTIVAQKLKPWMEEGLPILVCEPSCASALNDDLPDLIEDEHLADLLKKQVMMIDVFLASHLETEQSSIAVKHEEILIHGHCHQKALYGTEAMKKVLGNGTLNVQEIPSGCCGMAGSFGYEKEHYDLSEKIGRQILFPAVDSANKNTPIVACGFSCRHQIEHFTGRKAIHWVELFDE